MLVTGTRAAWPPGANTSASETATEYGLLPRKSGLWALSHRAGHVGKSLERQAWSIRRMVSLAGAILGIWVHGSCEKQEITPRVMAPKSPMLMDFILIPFFIFIQSSEGLRQARHFLGAENVAVTRTSRVPLLSGS